MVDNKLYFNDLNCVDKNNHSICIDMLRLKTFISPIEFDRYIDMRLPIYASKIEKWTSTQISEFYKNYKYSDDNCSFWFGYISNSEKYCSNGPSLQNENSKFNFTIEFNPNKVKNNRLLMTVLKCSTDWSVVSCDIAVDILTNIQNVTGFDKSRKKRLITYDCGKDDKTYYIGKGNNSVKIYNKTIESDLNYDLTRIELTKHFNNLNLKNVKNYSFKNSYFPKLYLKDFQITVDDLEIDNTLKAIIYAVNCGYPLHDLSRRYKANVEKFLQNKKPICIDFNLFGIVLVKYLAFYFPFISDLN